MGLTEEELRFAEENAKKFENHEWFDAHAKVVLKLIKEIREQKRENTSLSKQIVGLIKQFEAKPSKSGTPEELKKAILDYLSPLEVPLSDLKFITGFLDVLTAHAIRAEGLYWDELNRREIIEREYKEDHDNLLRQIDDVEKLRKELEQKFLDLRDESNRLSKSFNESRETLKFLVGAPIESIKKDPTIPRRVSQTAFLKMKSVDALPWIDASAREEKELERRLSEAKEEIERLKSK